MRQGFILLSVATCERVYVNQCHAAEQRPNLNELVRN